ncbi:MAG: hypothetical protein AB8I69_09640 [Anaerolineae bacterium]|jgi:hypothetical protein
MKNKWVKSITGLLILSFALGCGLSINVEERDTRATTISYLGGSGSEFTWPESIPEDIPVLEGDISLVMEAPGSHVRIFYQNLTKRQVEQYLGQLEEKGFDLEYIVYTREGFPDNSDGRTKRGEYDAVDITKGEYHMRLEYSSDTTTYDIYATGFQDGAK